MCQASTKHPSRATKLRDVCRLKYVTRNTSGHVERLAEQCLIKQGNPVSSFPGGEYKRRGG